MSDSSQDRPPASSSPGRDIDALIAERLKAGEPANRLIHEKSPYLLQHAFNPVDWYPWGMLRGFRHEHDHRQARRLMESLHIESTGGAELAMAAAQHYRGLRAQGITVRSGIDVLVAAFCIENDYALLHRDRDFDALESLRGLKVWRH